MPLIATIAVFGFLILVHELGHFILAKRNGVRVETFSLGMGPKLVGWKIGETTYQISAIPFGGYVKMAGEEDDSRDGAEEGSFPPDDFRAKTPGQRARIVAAGVVVNYLVAVVLFPITFMLGYEELVPRVGGFTEDSAAKAAGLQVGDLITSVDGTPIQYWTQLQQAVQKSGGKPMRVTVDRDGEKLEFLVTARRSGAHDDVERVEFGDEGPLLLGIIAPPYEEGNVVFVKAPPREAIKLGVGKTLELSKLTLLTMWKLVTGKISLRNAATGPVGIAAMTAEAAKLGLNALLGMMAFLSLALAIFNVLPIPVLDGGVLVFLAIEAVRGRPVPRKVQLNAQRVGLTLLLCLFAFITFNDIRRLAQRRQTAPAAESVEHTDAGAGGADAPEAPADEPQAE